MNICKYCKGTLVADYAGHLRLETRDYYGSLWACEKNTSKTFALHKPMNNLDYIEYLAEERNLV